MDALLSEYKDVNFEEFPKGLPHIRSISHQIDFIIGSYLPNESLHRMILVDNEELNKQEHDCLKYVKYQRQNNPMCTT